MTAAEQDTDSSPFETVSDAEFSRENRYRRWISANVLAPLRILINDPRGAVGLAIVGFFVLMGTVGIMIVPAPTGKGPILLTAFQSTAYPLGTTRYGAGVFRKIVHATPGMLMMMLGGAIFVIVVGTIIGTLSGLVGGRTDEFLMMISDTVMAIPGLPLIIVLTILFTPRNPFFVGVLISLPAWAGLARGLRSEVLSLREESFIEASRIMGLPTRTILAREVIPNLMPLIIISTVNAARAVIFASVGLYFLGILPQTFSNWGLMMQNAYEQGGLYTWQIAHWLIFPMVAIVLLSFGLIMLGQAGDKIFNPRLKARYANSSEETRSPK